MQRFCASVVLGLLLCARLAFSDVVCDGVDDILTNGAGTGKISVSTGTITALVKHAGSPSSGGTCGRDIILGQASNSIYELVVHSTSGWSAKNFDSTADCAFGTFSTDWTHLAWRHSAGNIELFVNGVLANTTASGNTTSLTHNVTLCWNGSTADAQTPITIAEIVFYDVAVSNDVLLAIGNSRVRGLRVGTPTAIWDFEDCVHAASVDGTNFNDRAGNSHNITADNGANNTGMSCAGSAMAVKMWGVQ